MAQHPHPPHPHPPTPHPHPPTPHPHPPTPPPHPPTPPPHPPTPPPHPPTPPPDQTIEVGKFVTLTRQKTIESCVSPDPTTVGAVFDPKSPNDVKLLGIKLGGPVTVSIFFTDKTFENIRVKVVAAASE